MIGCCELSSSFTGSLKRSAVWYLCVYCCCKRGNAHCAYGCRSPANDLRSADAGERLLGVQYRHIASACCTVLKDVDLFFFWHYKGVTVYESCGALSVIYWSLLIEHCWFIIIGLFNFRLLYTQRILYNAVLFICLSVCDNSIILLFFIFNVFIYSTIHLCTHVFCINQ